MCIEVSIEKNGIRTICDTTAELLAVFGGYPIDRKGNDLVKNSCLCPCDIEATAKKFGMIAKKNDEYLTGSFIDWFISKPTLTVMTTECVG